MISKNILKKVYSKQETKLLLYSYSKTLQEKFKYTN